MEITKETQHKAIAALRQCAKENENKPADTGAVRVTDLCRDVADYLEKLAADDVNHGVIATEPDPKANIKAKRIADCELSVRTIKICVANDIDTLGDLCKLHRTDWLRFRDGGKKSLFELDDLLHDHGLDWAKPEQGARG